MAMILKARSSVPGAVRLATGVLSNLINVGNIRKGIGRGDGGTGTLVGCVDTNGVNQGATGILDSGSAFYANGTLSSAGAYNATGVIYGAGNYATEASRNSMTAAEGDIVSGHSVTLLGVTTAGTLDMALWQLKTDSVLIAAISAGIVKIGEAITATTPPTHVDGTYNPGLETHTADQVLKSAGGNYNDDNLVVGNIRAVGFGLSQIGTLANLIALDAAYVALENTRNDDPGVGSVVEHVEYQIRGVPKEGTYVGGGGWTYGSNTASHVLTIATAPGSYQAVAATAVQKGVAVGVSPAVGLLEGIIDTAGAVTTVGCLVSGTRYASGTVSAAGAYNATGVIYGAGLYATEASRNSTTAAAEDIVSGHSVTLLGVTTAGTLDMTLWTEISTITWPTTDEVDGGVTYGIANERLGTGVNTTTLGTTLDNRGITTANKAQTGDGYSLLTKVAPRLVGTLSGAGTGTEICIYSGVTATYTVDVSGNITNVVLS